MSTTKSILLGSALILAGLLCDLGYTVQRDRAKDRARAAAYRSSESVRAWNAAVHRIDYELEDWIRSGAKLSANERISIPYVFVKSFEFSDVSWIDGRHARITGFVNGSKWKKGVQVIDEWFTWNQQMLLMDGGGWSADGEKRFAAATPTEEQLKAWRTKGIRIPE